MRQGDVLGEGTSAPGLYDGRVPSNADKREVGLKTFAESARMSANGIKIIAGRLKWFGSFYCIPVLRVASGNRSFSNRLQLSL
jgi:hypothetical protein